MGPVERLYCNIFRSHQVLREKPEEPRQRIQKVQSARQANEGEIANGRCERQPENVTNAVREPFPRAKMKQHLFPQPTLPRMPDTTADRCAEPADHRVS